MQPNPVAAWYETWWISPEGMVHDAVEDGVPGHCGWLRERFGICSRPEARAAGWIRVGWNMTNFYVDGRPERIEAERAKVEELLMRHPMVTRVLLEHGSDLDSVLTPEEFFEKRPPGLS
ncbi:MAG: hypothetical protein ACRDIF_01625 [Actinomycetota bacterium]